MTTGISKPQLKTAEDLKEHIKAVGQSIINDVDRLNIDPYLIRRIEIRADIEPIIEVTTVNWEIERIADPRVAK